MYSSKTNTHRPPAAPSAARSRPASRTPFRPPPFHRPKSPRPTEVTTAVHGGAQVHGRRIAGGRAACGAAHRLRPPIGDGPREARCSRPRWGEGRRMHAADATHPRRMHPRPCGGAWKRRMEAAHRMRINGDLKLWFQLITKTFRSMLLAPSLHSPLSSLSDLLHHTQCETHAHTVCQKTRVARASRRAAMRSWLRRMKRALPP